MVYFFIEARKIITGAERGVIIVNQGTTCSTAFISSSSEGLLKPRGGKYLSNHTTLLYILDDVYYLCRSIIKTLLPPLAFSF